MATIFFIYLAVINITSGYMMYDDKRRAIQKTWRIPESQLLTLCLIGGFLGTFCMMKFARHKTQHWQFHAAVIVAAIIWLFALPLFLLFY